MVDRTHPLAGSGVVFIAGFDNPVAADFAAFLEERSRAFVVPLPGPHRPSQIEAAVRGVANEEIVRQNRDLWDERTGRDCRNAVAQSWDGITQGHLVLFITQPMSSIGHGELEETMAIAAGRDIRSVAIVSSFRIHLDDTELTALENHVIGRAKTLFARVVIFRPGHVLSRSSPTKRLLQRLAPFSPLFPRWLTSCFVDGCELFDAIEAERLSSEHFKDVSEPWQEADTESTPSALGRPVGSHDRAFTLLGENRPWRDMLDRHRTRSFGTSVAAVVNRILSWFLIGQIAAFIFTTLARYSAWMRQWHVTKLRPASLRELVSLCHGRNIHNVRVVGYNNGVAHFGHRHPGKTVVSTVRCHRLALAGHHTLKADSGATIRNALDFLAHTDQDLYVVPNYSYVSLGTSFFVPIHGSAVDYATVADTIRRVVLYDPDTDRIIAAGRDDAAFREHIYNQQSRVVLLRLYILAKPKSRYSVRREALENPTAQALLAALHDASASNVEIRQAHAASSRVTISRYFTDLRETSSPALELPRDTLGRLWDRLEENPVTSFLMHALSRHVAWHTELFFTPEQFEVFWRTHGQLPLRKIQLRYLKRDGLPHSPCRDDDCVSADLFMFRRNRHRFFAYLENTFSVVRTNPGKHSH